MPDQLTVPRRDGEYEVGDYSVTVESTTETKEIDGHEAKLVYDDAYLTIWEEAGSTNRNFIIEHDSFRQHPGTIFERVLVTPTNDLYDHIVELVDEDDDEAVSDDDGLPSFGLPSFGGYQMVEKPDVWFCLDVYVDERGGVWFVHEGEPISESLDLGGASTMSHSEIDNLVEQAEDAQRSVSHDGLGIDAVGARIVSAVDIFLFELEVYVDNDGEVSFTKGGATIGGGNLVEGPSALLKSEVERIAEASKRHRN